MKKRAAFTLIEVMIAMVIIAIAFTAILRTTNISLDGSQHLQQRQTAEWVASNVLTAAQIGSLRLPLDSQSFSGTTRMLGQTYDWTLTRHKSRYPGIEQMTVTVKQHKQNLYTLQGTRLNNNNSEVTL